MTTYEVRDNQHQTISTHRSEAAALAVATKTEGGQVIMRETSGTYKSSTCIYPEVGDTYSN